MGYRSRFPAGRRGSTTNLVVLGSAQEIAVLAELKFGLARHRSLCLVDPSREVLTRPEVRFDPT